MGEAVDRLMVKLTTVRIYVPAHVRIRNGRRENVDGYTREVSVDSRGRPTGDLSTRERKAFKESRRSLLDRLGEMTPEQRESALQEVSKGGGRQSLPEWQGRVEQALGRQLEKPDKGRLQIRKSTYRGKEGFTISGRPPGGSAFPVKVFVETREEAEKARDNIRAGKGAFSGKTPEEERSDIDAARAARATSTKSGHRPLSDIARDIRADWTNPNFAAKPYLDALRDLDDITDKYGADSAESVVNYFLSNATTWRGETARRIKAELKAAVKRARR